MKKNGFTLIELVGAILILGLLSAIVVPSVMKIMRNAKDKAYEEQIGYIEKTAEKWGIYNVNKLSTTRNYYLSTEDLLAEGYIDGADIKDPRNSDNVISGCVIIKYDNAYNQYTYDFTTSACQTLGSNIVETAASCFTVSGATITGYTCDDRSITIPKKIGGTAITTIGSAAFKNKYLSEVEMQEGIVTIAANAFEDNRLKEITIPSSVRTIGNYAFNNNKINTVSLSNNVTSVGNYAFANNRIKNLTLSTSLNQIAEGAFMDNMIGSVTLSSGITTVGTSAFKGNSITSLTIKSGVRTINNSAFMDNNIVNVNFPSTLTTIGPNAFVNNAILDIKVPSNLVNFDCSAFMNNGTTSLTFLGDKTTLQNVSSCVNTNNKYKISTINVPVGTKAYYSAYDGNSGDDNLNSWRINER